ncbi:hypothetical protein BDN70DRAFT_675245 [Pholiota conissans]|uniref:DUF6699 domain-containing protein n=1 Tax=Pholiota conissans TaxID=109636 RepID=A0A9P5ZDG4_9AGAR|nr:hypothetical protein BDN70DRAFT_675245 [Pholiota conissans]
MHHLLVYSQHNVLGGDVAGHPCLISWDMRTPTEYARYIDHDQPLSFNDLAQPATEPSLESLEITCGFFPGDWPIQITHAGGITVGDVLDAIHNTIIRRISHAEWNLLSERQQDRIKVVFNNRWQAAADPDVCRQNGVLRMDCLLQHTKFGGLSVSLEADDSCILSLRRQA